MKPDPWSEPVPPAKGDVIVSVQAKGQPPSLVWGPIIGDIVHGFRSALDQLAWGLSVAFQTNPPPADPIPGDDPWRKVWFPVCLRESVWVNGAVPQQLNFIDPTLLAALKQLQPFATGQNAPHREPLAVLQELWNIDKHRHLHLVNVTVELGEVITRNPLPGEPRVVLEIVSKRAPGPVVGRTEIGRVRVNPWPGTILPRMLPMMHMYPHAAIDVAFDQGAPAYGGRVLHTLREIGKTVETIIGAC